MKDINYSRWKIKFTQFLKRFFNFREMVKQWKLPPPPPTPPKNWKVDKLGNFSALVGKKMGK